MKQVNNTEAELKQWGTVKLNILFFRFNFLTVYNEIIHLARTQNFPKN